jgi:hypothetical protein
MIKEVPCSQKGQRIYDKCKKTIANYPESSGNEAEFSSSSEFNINGKEGLNSFKIDQTHHVSSLNKSLCSLEESLFSNKMLSQVKYPTEKITKIKGAVKR